MFVDAIGRVWFRRLVSRGVCWNGVGQVAHWRATGRSARSCSHLGRVAGDWLLTIASITGIRRLQQPFLSPAMAHFTLVAHVMNGTSAFVSYRNWKDDGLFAPRGSRNLAFF